MLLEVLTSLTLTLMAPVTAAAGPPQLEWTSTNAPGIHLTLEETGRTKTRDGWEVRYRIRAEGLPLQETYWQYAHWMDRETFVMPEPFTLDEQGIVQFKGGSFELSLHHMLRGEPFGLALVSRESGAKAFAEVIPFPLEAMGEGGCKIHLTLVTTASGGAFFMRASGFAPGEAVHVVSKSGREAISSTQAALEDGTVNHMISPGVVGKRGGEASVTVSGTSCTASLVYEWGRAMRMQ